MTTKNKKEWKVLVSDDDGSIHLETEIALEGFTFEGRPIKLLKATSAEQTIKILRKESGIAVLLLDVVMEGLNSGLDIVPVIRNDIGNREIRIVIRTGYVGKKTFTETVQRYDINDFKSKSKLDDVKLRDTITLALRDYRDIINAVDKNKKD